jgi:hypothetical protein
MVGLLPLIAVEILDEETLAKLPGFRKRMQWFLENRKDLAKHISYMDCEGGNGHGYRLLAIPSRERLQRALRYMLDENEFLSPYGIRASEPVVVFRQEPPRRAAFLPAKARGERLSKHALRSLSNL